MTRDELVAHCKRMIAEYERLAAIQGKELLGNKVYEEHRFILTLLTQSKEHEISLADAILFAEQGHSQAHEYLEKIVSQKPFINEPCVAKQSCHEDQMKVLDKIKFEIGQDAFNVNGANYISLNRVNQIIDKYMAESEAPE